MSPTIKAFVCLAAAALILAACDSQPKVSDRNLKQIDADHLQSLLQDDKSTVVLVDPRSPARYSQGHLPGAINIPMPQMAAHDARLSGADHIVVYGSGWQDYISMAAAKRLMSLGYPHVLDFRGGVELWRSQDLPLDSQ